MLSVDELVGAVVETITELDRLASTFIFFTCEDVALIHSSPPHDCDQRLFSLYDRSHNCFGAQI